MASPNRRGTPYPGKASVLARFFTIFATRKPPKTQRPSRSTATRPALVGGCGVLPLARTAEERRYYVHAS